MWNIKEDRRWKYLCVGWEKLKVERKSELVVVVVGCVLMLCRDCGCGVVVGGVWYIECVYRWCDVCVVYMVWCLDLSGCVRWVVLLCVLVFGFILFSYFFVYFVFLFFYLLFFYLFIYIVCMLFFG